MGPTTACAAGADNGILVQERRMQQGPRLAPPGTVDTYCILTKYTVPLSYYCIAYPEPILANLASCYSPATVIDGSTVISPQVSSRLRSMVTRFMSRQGHALKLQSARLWKENRQRQVLVACQETQFAVNVPRNCFAPRGACLCSICMLLVTF